MRQIYDFEQYNPPVLNENMLRRELEKRQLRRQLILLAVAAVMSQAVMIMLGILTWEIQPVISSVCFGYVGVSVTGSAVIAIAYSYRDKGGNEVWQV